MQWIQRVLVASCVIAATAGAGEADAAVAPPGRWSDPRGTASGGLRSAALPVTGQTEGVWSIELPGKALAAPVHWDGVGYVFCEDEKRRRLLAFDLQTGVILAKLGLNAGPPTQPVVWDRVVYLRTSSEQVCGYRVYGRSLRRVWSDRLGSALGDPVVFENEVYVVSDTRLWRLRRRPRVFVPEWGIYRFFGRPAVYGQHVYVLSAHQSHGWRVRLTAFRRSDCDAAATVEFARYVARDAPDGDNTAVITVTPGNVFVRAPGAMVIQNRLVPCVSIGRHTDGDRIHLDQAVVPYPYEFAPSSYRDGAVALAKQSGFKWVHQRGDKAWVLADQADHPELFRDVVPATILGDVVYFGSWAADLETHEILWRLPVTVPRFPAVPADGLLLVVDGTNRLHAFRERRSD